MPERYRDRNLYVHNPTITLMRTTPDECREIGRIVAAQAERGDRADRALRPACAASRRSRPRARSFHDAEADEALFETIRSEIDASKVELHELDTDVNDPAFALAMANRLHELIVGGAA